MKFFVVLYGIFITVLGKVCDKQFVVETDLKPEDCPEGKYYFPYSKKNFCFPMCSEVQKGAKCGQTTNPCTPGFLCVNNNCVVDENSCFKYYNNHPGVNNPYVKSLIKPKCNKNGKYEAKQCKGEIANGRCFCYDEIGARIYGQEWSTNAANMTCACSRKKAELRKIPTKPYVSLHCDSMGNYEPLQCDSKLCWCVDNLNGELTSKVVPEKHMSSLPCFIKRKTYNKYLRKCESIEFANAVISTKMNKHGTKYPNLLRINCDEDGSYGPIQFKNSIATCTSSDGKPIGSFQSPAQQMGTMDCKCARDRKLYEDTGKKFSMDCENNGNYLYEQQAKDGKYYCVDSDGFKKNEGYYKTIPSKEECDKYLSF